MAKGAGFASRGEMINHFGAITLRVVGSGNLVVNYYSLDDSDPDVDAAPVETLLPYAMVSQTRRQPTLLANTKEQRASIEVAVTEINEWFSIERIVVFMKPLFTQFPGRG